jgi:hypothetical protein
VVDELELWKFPRTLALAAMVHIAEQRLAPPDLRACPISSRGDVLTVQLVEGAWAAGEEPLLYVRERGAFVVLRREEWPGGRVLLTLRAQLLE